MFRSRSRLPAGVVTMIMLVMNMAFLRKEEVYWLFALPGRLMKSRAPEPVK